MMHSFLFTRLLASVLVIGYVIQLRAQAPDMNPDWTRYAFVEDSSELVPLKGDYRVYHLQYGMWWNYQEPSPVIGPLPEKGIRLLPLFDPDVPAFRATPARGIDFPEEKLVVIRERDTMIVELSGYYPALSFGVSARCARMKCERRPPMVMPFRPGWYLPNGLPFENGLNTNLDHRTLALTQAFDRLWERAEKEERVVPQLNSDTCVQDLFIPAGFEVLDTTGGTRYSDTWLMRSPYCGTQLVRFPSLGTTTEYTITFVPYQPEKHMDPVHIRSDGLGRIDALVDVTDWPVGDHHLSMSWGDDGSSIMLKVR